MPSKTTDLIVVDGACVFCSGFARFMAWADRQLPFNLTLIPERRAYLAGPP